MKNQKIRDNEYHFKNEEEGVTYTKQTMTAGFMISQVVHVIHKCLFTLTVCTDWMALIDRIHEQSVNTGTVSDVQQSCRRGNSHLIFMKERDRGREVEKGGKRKSRICYKGRFQTLGSFVQHRIHLQNFGHVSWKGFHQAEAYSM